MSEFILEVQKMQKPRAVVLVEFKTQEDTPDYQELKIRYWMENQQLQELQVGGLQQEARDKSNGRPT